MRIIQLVHFAGFGFAFVGCLFALWRTRDIPHVETRYGLYGLFITSGVWAGAYLVTFVASSLELATVAYQIGLICGIISVFAWIYFCSAYTGESYHQKAVYRRGAVVLLLSIVAVKLTNPFHGLYFTIELVETPFPHASVTLLDIHWAVTVLAYSLATVGFYMLLQLFTESNIPTTQLTFLFGLTALPVLLNITTIFTDTWVVANNYEPIGVAVFALGTLYVAQDTFERVRWIGRQQVFDKIDEAILLLDGGGHIYQYNAAAEELFPDIEQMRKFETVLSNLSTSESNFDDLEWAEGELLSLTNGPTTQYYLLRETELTVGPHTVGRAVAISDVTRIERQRRELKRQSEQLEGFSEAIAHELRNSVVASQNRLDFTSSGLN